jgi:hypothetical protein
LKVHTLVKHGDHPEVARMVAPAKSSKVGKPFCCPYSDCPSGYVRRSDLVRHIEKKHGDFE